MAKSFVSTQVRGFVRGVKVVTMNDTNSKITFSIPHQRSFFDKKTNEWRESITEWYNMSIWGNPENKWFQSALKSVVDGAYICIDNCLRELRTFDGKDGTKQIRLEYKVVDFYVVGGVHENDSSTGRGKAAGAGDIHREEAAGSVFDEGAPSGDDMPF